MKLTVYTPIHANYEMLPAVFSSLMQQTSKEFIWFLINYGNENTIQSLVAIFIAEAEFKIIYRHIPLKGRYKATKLVFEEATTNYIIGAPPMFLLQENAVEVMINQWTQIEEEHRTDIAEIRAFAADSDNEPLGTKFPLIPDLHLDAFWHEMTLKHGYSFEATPSWDRIKFLECVDIDSYPLYEDMVDELPTYLFWSAIGRKYKTRYVKDVLKHKQAVPLLQEKGNRYNDLVGSYYFINENWRYVSYNLKYFIVRIILMLRNAYKLHIPFCRIIGFNNPIPVRLLLIVLSFPVWILNRFRQ